MQSYRLKKFAKRFSNISTSDIIKTKTNEKNIGDIWTPEYINYNIDKLLNVDESFFAIADKFENIRYITLAPNFDSPIDLSNMKKLTSLTLGDRFNQVLSKEILPPNLLKLKLGWNYSRALTSLPDTLQELILNDRFNNEIVLPSSLVKLITGALFNHKITVPVNLKTIQIKKELITNLSELNKSIFI